MPNRRNFLKVGAAVMASSALAPNVMAANIESG